MDRQQDKRKFIILGDVMLGRGVNEVTRKAPPTHVWGNTLDIIKSADYSLINLECALTYHEEQWDEFGKAFYFRADPGPAIAILRAANITCACLANNHILDFREEGLVDTLHFLDRAGICRAGAGRNLAEAREPAYRDVGGLKVGLMAFTDNEPSFAAGHESAGVNYVPIHVDTDQFNSLLESVSEAKQACDILIVSTHWGPNMVFRPSDEFREAAHRLVNAGADIIHGHSAHNFQGIEIYNGRPIMYSTGDFIDDYATDPIYRNDWSFIFVINLSGAEFESIDLYPVRVLYAQTNLAIGMESVLIVDRMESMCAEFNTRTVRQQNKLTIPIFEERARIA
ncbi:MAG: CapA family protein [Firmicutes bacterium]|nr:CapA family protein [Bacillota bacterium]